MDIRIDWLSWTLTTGSQPTNFEDCWHLAEGLLRREHSGMAKEIFGGYGFQAGSGRPPYRVAVVRNDNGLRVYGNSHTGTVLFELTGAGSAALRDFEVVRTFLATQSDRITRLDIACDVRTDTRPSDFCTRLAHDRFRSRSEITSDTGQTVYIGSPKSDRFARVYRYSPPHPRAELLRVEYVFRRGMAQCAAEDIAQLGDPRTFAATCGNTWGWTHKDWKPSVVTDEKTTTPNLTKSDQDTVMWLYKQVAPAMRRLIAEGALDTGEFLAYVLGVGKDDPVDRMTAERLHDTWD